MSADVDHLRRTAEAQHHSSGDVHGVSVKPSALLALLDLADAAHSSTEPLPEAVRKALDRIYSERASISESLGSLYSERPKSVREALDRLGGS